MLNLVRLVEFFREYGDKFRYSKICFSQDIPSILSQKLYEEINQELELGNYLDKESVSSMAKDVLQRYEINADKVTIVCHVTGFSKS